MSLGFEKAGFNVVSGIDNWKAALRVYEMNFEHSAIEQDLSDVDGAVKVVSKFVPDLIIGGPPCQDFSTAGFQDESRGRAILSICYSQIVSEIQVNTLLWKMLRQSAIRTLLTRPFRISVKLDMG